METHPFDPRIRLTRWWPANAPVNTEDIDCAGDWLILMSAGGAMLLHHAGDPMTDMVRDEFFMVYAGEEDVLRKALSMFCKRGYPCEAEEIFIHTGGIPYIFNWRSYTLWQLGVAQRIFHLFATGKVDEAWTFGKWAADQIQAAEAAVR